jgi:hypothetical protein
MVNLSDPQVIGWLCLINLILLIVGMWIIYKQVEEVKGFFKRVPGTITDNLAEAVDDALDGNVGENLKRKIKDILNRITKK